MMAKMMTNRVASNFEDAEFRQKTLSKIDEVNSYLGDTPYHTK